MEKSKNNVIVLGGGLIGKPIVLDLIRGGELKLSVADNNPDVIRDLEEIYDVPGIVADLSNAETIMQTVAGFDYVINAVPGFMGYNTVKALIQAGKDVVDIAFSPEDMKQLHSMAEKKGVTVLTDFGVAPGLSHLIVAHASVLFDEMKKVRIYVGGLPMRRTKPFEYSAVFSPLDVIEEYTRPARLIQNGKLVVKEALTDIELLDFDRIGTLEAFNSDGLRSLVKSQTVEDMAEKTLRYPGHAQLMKTLRDIGFFEQKKMEIDGVLLSPMDMTARLLFPLWEMKGDDRDITVMKIIVKGSIGGKAHKFSFDLYDEFDERGNIHSMARTTGYTATMGLRLLRAGLFKQKGVFYPEVLGKDRNNLDFILKGLGERGIKIKMKLEKE